MTFKGVILFALLILPQTLFGAWESIGLRKLVELPKDAHFVEEEFRSGNRSVRLRGVVFSSRNFTLRVIENPGGNMQNLATAMQSTGCIAGTNGGYFHPDFRPLGLVVSNGVELHGLERARLLSGLISARKGEIDLDRFAEFRKDGVRDALQAGPFLIDDGQPVAGLESSRIARRTIVATDGKRNWALLIASSCSLADAAEILSVSKIFGAHSIRRALNLDGGSSTGLWVNLPGDPFLISPLVPVSNYLGVAPLP